jgi:predicted metal-dependent hydrolase
VTLLLRRKYQPDPNQLSLPLGFFFPEPETAPVAATPKRTLERNPAQPLAPVLVPEPKPRSAPPPGTRRIQLQEHSLDYRLIRSKRRTIGFLIDEEGLRVTAPKWVTLAEIDLSIREKQRWIFSKLNEQRERYAKRLQPTLQWRDGASLPYLGHDIVLRIRPQHAGGISFDEATQELTVSLPAGASEQQLKDRVLGWLQLRARAIFAERLPQYAEKLGVRYRSFALSSATTQWGSCTVEGKIRLNWRLIHFSLPLIDYVIAHELSHLREMNHSPAFWATVQSVFPEFQEARKALREHTPDSLPAF